MIGGGHLNYPNHDRDFERWRRAIPQPVYIVQDPRLCDIRLVPAYKVTF
jgi:hypothetical protein